MLLLWKLAVIKFDFKALHWHVTTAWINSDCVFSTVVWTHSKSVWNLNIHYCSDVVQDCNFSSFVLSRNYYAVKSSYLFLMRILHTEHKVSLNIITVSELKNIFTDIWEIWLCDYTVNRFTFMSNNLTQNIPFKAIRHTVLLFVINCYIVWHKWVLLGSSLHLKS